MSSSLGDFSALANAGLDAAQAHVPLQPVPAEKIVSGDAKVGAVPLLERVGLSIGLWEITPSVTTDVEAQEMFLVVAGEGRVTFEDGSEPLDLRPGTIGRLAAGAKTTWHVSKTLRKVYIAYEN